MLNIPSYIEDPNYRYKMPKLVIKIEGKGNGIKTNLTNLIDVAAKLQTDPEYILKFIGIELGSKTTYAEIGKNNISSIIQGKFDYEIFLKHLDKFINKYICCPKCTYPQMHMYVKKNKVMGACDSCGFDGELDSTHDVTTLMKKKPPKESKKIKTAAKPIDGLEIVANETEGVVKNKKTKLSKEDLALGGEKLNECLQRIQEYYKQTVTGNENTEILAADLTTEIKSIGIEKTLSDRFGYLIFNFIFDDSISKQIKPLAPLYKILIKKFASETTSLETLMNLEYFYTQRKDQEIRKFAPTILKYLMEEEIVDEEFLIQWATGKGEVTKLMEEHFLFTPQRDQEFREIVKQFIEWLTQQDQEQEQKQ